MTTTITSTQLARNLSDILNRVRYRGERFRIVRAGELVACLEPGPSRERFTSRQFVELMKALPVPDADFEEDLKEIRAAQGRIPVSAWDS